MRLYSYFRSSCAYRVRIVLNFKGLEYETIPIHLLKDGGKQHSKDYIEVNPQHQVPSLEVEGQVLNQSMAICLYLEDAYPAKPLLSNNIWTRAQQIAFCEVINSGVQPMQNLSVVNKLDEDFKVGAEGKKKWTLDFINKYFEALEIHLRKTSGKFCFGDSISLADCFLVPQIFSAKRFGVDMNRYPLIDAVGKNAEVLEPFVLAHPSKQPDFEA